MTKLQKLRHDAEKGFLKHDIGRTYSSLDDITCKTIIELCDLVDKYDKGWDEKDGLIKNQKVSDTFEHYENCLTNQSYYDDENFECDCGLKIVPSSISKALAIEKPTLGDVDD